MKLTQTAIPAGEPFPMQKPPLRRWFRDPIFLLAVFAALLAIVVQSGELGTADTTWRLQATHAFWTPSLPVYPQDYAGGYGAHGRNGTLQGWYGIGQSLLMLAADMAGTALEKLPIFAEYNGNDPAVRSMVVVYSTQILITVLTALVCLRLLGQFGFNEKQAVAGVLGLLLLTTHLHYTQNMMENNYIFLLTVAGFCWQYEWLRTGSRRALLVGSAAFGLNLLTRLTTGMDLMAGGLFLVLALWMEGARGRELWRRCRGYLATALPVYAVFIFLDRLYQFYRYGSFFNTYMSVVANEAKQMHPDWPKSYPFNTPFHTGFFGALFAPEKSIFLFDPLLVLLVLLAVVAWRRFTPVVKAYLIAGSALLMAYICFYARYVVWSGDDAWGDRYVSTTVELIALLALPLLLRHRGQLGKPLWIAGLAIAAISAVVQAASLAFWLPLEIYQMDNLGHPAFVIALRLKNIVAFALGNTAAWGLDTPAMHEDAWDYVHITTWNFLPFLLKRVGEAPAWAVNAVFAAWYGALAALAWTLWRLRKTLSIAENQG